MKRQTAASAASEKKSTWTRIGAVGKAHGIKGAFYISERRSLLEKTPELIIIGDSPSSGASSMVSGYWAIKDRDVLSLTTLDSRTKCEARRGQSLWIPKADEPTDSLENLVGLAVVDSAGIKLGRVLNFYNYGASDTIEIGDDKNRSLELPYIPTYFSLPQINRDGPVKMLVLEEIVAELWQPLEDT